jgi:hypothetical protein
MEFHKSHKSVPRMDGMDGMDMGRKKKKTKITIRDHWWATKGSITARLRGRDPASRSIAMEHAPAFDPLRKPRSWLARLWATKGSNLRPRHYQ